jgi:hypothetical protein
MRSGSASSSAVSVASRPISDRSTGVASLATPCTSRSTQYSTVAPPTAAGRTVMPAVVTALSLRPAKTSRSAVISTRVYRSEACTPRMRASWCQLLPTTTGPASSRMVRTAAGSQSAVCPKSAR